MAWCRRKPKYTQRRIGELLTDQTDDLFVVRQEHSPPHHHLKPDSKMYLILSILFAQSWTESVLRLTPQRLSASLEDQSDRRIHLKCVTHQKTHRSEQCWGFQHQLYLSGRVQRFLDRHLGGRTVKLNEIQITHGPDWKAQRARIGLQAVSWWSLT